MVAAKSDVMKVAVVGVGSLGQHHARILADAPGAKLIGVVDANIERAREIATKYNVAAFQRIEELPPVDGVSIAAPTTLHREIAEYFLKKSVGVMCEKPMAATVGECDAILKARDLGRAKLVAGHIEHFNPGVRALALNVKEPGFLEVHRLGVFTGRSLDVDVILDLMIHDIEIAQSLVKQPVERVEAVGVRVLTRHVDIANARLTFKGGCVANLTASRISKDKVRKLRVFQPDAYLAVDYAEQAVECYRVESSPSGRSIAKVEVPVEKQEPLRLELEHFIRVLRGEEEPLVGGEQARDAVAVAREVLACMER